MDAQMSNCAVSQPFEAIRRHREEVVTLSANSIGEAQDSFTAAWPGRRVIAISNKAPGCRTWYALLAAPAPVRGTSPLPEAEARAAEWCRVAQRRKERSC